MTVSHEESSTQFRRLCRNYYYGNLDAIYQDFLDRFTSPSSTLEKKSFVFENEAVKGINRRVNFLPTDIHLDGRAIDPTAYRFYQDYFKGNYFDGRPLSILLRKIYLEMELGGVAFLVAHKNPRTPSKPTWVLMTNVEYYPITSNDDQLDIIGYRFVYYKQQLDKNQQPRDIKLEIIVDHNGYSTQLGGQVSSSYKMRLKDADGQSVLPVVAFVREDLNGLYYRPGMADLLNGQRNLNAALTKRNEATKYDSFGVWCPAESEFSGLNFTNENTTTQQLAIRPGSYIPFPIRKVGAPTNIPATEREIEDARADIRAASVFTDPSELRSSSSGSSGYSKLVAARGLRDYSTQILSQVRSALNQLLNISALLGKVGAAELAIKMPLLEKEDPRIAAAKAAKLHQWGFEREGLRISGYTNDEIEHLLRERHPETNAP